MEDNTVVNAKTRDGKTIPFVFKNDAPSGTMKQVFFAPDKKYVVALFHKMPDNTAIQRLEALVGKYRDDIFGQIGGDYWKNLFCWPDKIVECQIDGQKRIGFTMPVYPSNFFFKHDKNRKGGEKNAQWFTDLKLFRNIDAREKGDFLQYMRISLKLARAMRRLHMAGLAHSDLSYKNVLIDPEGGNLNVIDVDGLVVPGKFPPDVLGTAGFIAPEIVSDDSKPKKVLPTQLTDRHALAVLIYMYLLHRHPLRGGRFFGDDDAEDEETLLMGKDPLYIEHPTDNRNKNMKREYGAEEYAKSMPWIDLQKFSAEKIAGEFLAKQFERAFIDGLKNPTKRPLPGDWEAAILKTIDRLLPCSNPKCTGKYFVFDNSKRPVCPFCGTAYQGIVPKLEMYNYNAVQKKFVPENYQVMVWKGQSLQKWHVNKRVVLSEKLSAEDMRRVGYFEFHKGNWLLVNEKLPDLYEIEKDGTRVHKKPGNPGDFIVLKDGTQILFSYAEKEKGARLAVVQLAGK